MRAKGFAVARGGFPGVGVSTSSGATVRATCHVSVIRFDQHGPHHISNNHARRRVMNDESHGASKGRGVG